MNQKAPVAPVNAPNQNYLNARDSL